MPGSEWLPLDAKPVPGFARNIGSTWLPPLSDDEEQLPMPQKRKKAPLLPEENQRKQKKAAQKKQKKKKHKKGVSNQCILISDDEQDIKDSNMLQQLRQSELKVAQLERELQEERQVAKLRRNDHYEVLGLGDLRSRATQDQIKKAYRDLAKIYHSDKPASGGSTDRFVRIKDAYEHLKDVALRQEYDKHHG